MMWIDRQMFFPKSSRQTERKERGLCVPAVQSEVLVGKTNVLYLVV